MAANVREVELALQVSTSNVDAIRKLQSDVANLAKSSGDAAPEFQKLSAELEKLAQDAVGLQKLTEAAASVDKVAAAQAAAADKARELTAAYNALKAKTDEAAAAQANAKAEYDKAKATTAELGDAIKQLKADNTGAARETDAYKSALKDLITQQIASRASTRELKAAHDESKAATTAARTEQGSLSNEYRNATAQAAALSAKLQQQQADYADLARATTGVSTAQVDLIGSGAKLQAAMSAVQAEAAKLTDAQEKAALSAKALADANAAAATRAQADAAAYAQWWKNALAEQDAASAKAAAALRQQGIEAKSAAESIKTAFGTVGAQSVQALEAKIAETEKAMRTLRNSGQLLGPELKVAMKQGEEAIAGLERQIRAAKGELTLMDRATNLWNTSMGGIKVGTLAAAAAISSVIQKVAELGPAMVKAITENERLVQSLNNIFKSSEVAASQIAFLRQSANDAGVAVSGIQQSFVKFSAAMNGANIPLEQSNALFTALTKAGGSLGLSTDAVNRAMEALGQMASKGTVSMEELRQQLGDALPGALGIAAKGLGLTEAEVIKLVSSGQLAAKDFFPAFTQGLKTVSGEANTLAQNFERLKNSVSAIFIAIGDAGALTLLKSGLEGVSFVTKGVGFTLTSAAEGIRLLGTTSATVAQELFRGNGLSAGLDKVSENAVSAGGRIAKLRDELYNKSGMAKLAAQSQAELAAMLDKSASAAGRAGQELIKYNLLVAEQAAKLETSAKAAEINVKTAETLATAQINAAKGIGDMTLAIQAEIDAKTAILKTNERLLSVRESELAMLKKQLEKSRELLAADGELDKNDRDRLEVMQQEIDKREAVVQGLRAKVTASREEVGQSKVEQQTHKDNSGRIAELTEAYNVAKSALENLRKSKIAGTDISKQEAAATQNLRDASILLNDAYADNEKKLKAKGLAQQASNEKMQAAFELQKANYESLGALGRVIGDVNLQRQAEIGKLDIQIKMSEASANAMKVEAEGKIKVAEATLALMKTMNELNPVRKAEQEAAIANAQAQIDKANAILKANDALKQQITSLRNGSSAQSNFQQNVNGTNTALGNQTAALRENIAAWHELQTAAGAAARAAKLSDEELKLDLSGDKYGNRPGGLPARNAAISEDYKRRKAKGQDAEGFSVDPKTGKRYEATGTDKNSMLAKLAAMGYDTNDPAAQRAAEQVSAHVTSLFNWHNGVGFSGMGSSKTVEQQLQEAMAGSLGVARTVGANQGSRGSNSGAPGGYGVAKTYNVTLGGTTVKTASDEDAQKLMGMLKQAKGSA